MTTDGPTADDLKRGIDPFSLRGGSLNSDASRAAEASGPAPLSAACVRAAYTAVADAGDKVSDGDQETIRSVTAGARAAAEAVEVTDEIGGGAGLALRSAARAWYPHAVEGQAATWRAGLKAFSNACDAADHADQDVIVRGVAAAAEAVRDDESATGKATRTFARELLARTDNGEALPQAWESAAARTREETPDQVFLLVVDAVTGVLETPRA